MYSQVLIPAWSLHSCQNITEKVLLNLDVSLTLNHAYLFHLLNMTRKVIQLSRSCSSYLGYGDKNIFHISKVYLPSFLGLFI